MSKLVIIHYQFKFSSSFLSKINIDIHEKKYCMPFQSNLSKIAT